MSAVFLDIEPRLPSSEFIFFHFSPDITTMNKVCLPRPFHSIDDTLDE